MKSSNALAPLLIAALTCGCGGASNDPRPASTFDSSAAPIPAGQAVTLEWNAAGASRFPLFAKTGQRYLLDATGRPFFVHGESAWALIVQLQREEVDRYLDNRRAKGFNTIMVQLIVHGLLSSAPSFDPPNNIYGDPPFFVAGDFSTPNEAYFAHADYVIGKAEEKGFVVLLAPAYMGYRGGDQGWYAAMTANGASKLRAYGRYVASRLHGHDNIVWLHGGDHSPPDKNLLRAVAEGIRDVDTKWLHSFHGSEGTSALGFLGTGESWLTLNNIYTYGSVVSAALEEYDRAPMPFFLVEGRYEGSGPNEGASETLMRSQAYQAVLSGAMGHVMGGGPVWCFCNGWQTALDTNPGAQTLVHLGTLFDSLPWWTLEPDRDGTVLTNGNGADPSRAAAARAADGSFALVYTPAARSLTVDLSRLAGPEVRARWYDPASGIYAPVARSPFRSASGSHTFAPAGKNANGHRDRVLVLESIPWSPLGL